MKNIFVSVLLAISLILLGLIVYNNKVIESKNNQIAAVEQKQKNTEEKFDRVSTQLDTLISQVEIANKSYKELSIQLANIDKKKNNYTKELKEIRDADEDTRKFLDRSLPADVKRLLNDAIAQ